MKKTKVSEVLEELKKDNKSESVVDAYLKIKKDLDKAESIHRKEWEGTEGDKIYNGEILSFRHPGMGNAIHIMKADNPISIMTLQMSNITECIRKGIYTLKDLEEMVNVIKKNIYEEQNKEKDGNNG